MSAARSAATVAGIALLAAGCSADVSTAVDVTSPSAASVTVTATFTDEAAQALDEGSEGRKQLIELFTDRSGHAPKVDSSKDRLVVASTVDYTQLTSLGDVVGVRGMTLAGGEDRATVRLALQPAAKLTSVVGSVTASQPDAAPLASTMLQSTTLTVRVHFDGGVDSVASTAGPAPVTKADTVSVVRAANDTSVSELTVVGDPTGHHPWYVYLAAAVGAVGVGVGAVRARLRRFERVR